MPFNSLTILWTLVSVLFFTETASASSSSTNLFIYNPNKGAAIFAGCLYVLFGVILLSRIAQFRHWWGLCLPIGAIASGLGFFIRYIMAKNSSTSTGLYVLEDTLIVCSPAAFLAFNYILYGRLVRSCIGSKHSLVRPEIVGRVFVISDISTFLIQAAGGGMEVQEKTRTSGEHIFLIGLIAQTASYVVFMGLLFRAHWGVRKEVTFTGRERWLKIVWLLYFSSFFIVIRSAYRVISGAQGRFGFLAVHEAYFYALDTLPLLLAIGIYMPFWPGKYAELSTKILETHGMTELYADA